ncbi:MAG: glyceraldehyde-3-phosphate dehydrogenase, partial [Micrococcales bacterium]
MSQAWEPSIEAAEQLIPAIGRLYRQNGVLLSIHGRSLVNRSPVELVKAHRYARHVDGVELDLNRTLALVRHLEGLRLGPCSIDVARVLAIDTLESLANVLSQQLATVIGGEGKIQARERDVILYGFGRIGRLVARILLAHAGAPGGLRLRAIVVRRGSADDLFKRASLLRRDSVHGKFAGTIVVDEANQSIVANGKEIRVIYSDDPAGIDYEAYGIHDALLIDNTGKWRDEAGLSQHLESKGVDRVLLTAPGKGALPNVVFGVNSDHIDPQQKIIAAASCTTNAISPVLSVLDAEVGIDHGHVETVHSFTNDQNLIDNFHKGERRGRSAVLNRVIAETGAATA